MKKIVLLGLALIVALSVIYLFRSEEITNYPSKNIQVIAFGDSLIEGVGSTPGNDLVTQLSLEINQPILNFGRSGDTTEMALSRINSVLDQKPKVAIVLLGGNDFLRKVPREETYANLKKIVTDIQRTGAVVIVLGVRSGLFGGNSDDMYEQLVEETKSFYVPDVLDGLFGKREFMADNIHPNDLGYSKIAERVLPVLRKAVK